MHTFLCRVTVPRWIVGLLAVSCLGSSPLEAQIGRLGEPFVLDAARTCQLANGDLAAVWLESNLSQTAFLRIYSPSGIPRGDAIVIDDDSPGLPDLGCRPGGGLVAVWGLPSETFGMNSLAARLFDDTGTPEGDVISVTGESILNFIATVAASEGGFLINWYREFPSSPDRPTHFVRRFGLDGLPMGGELQVDDGAASLEPASDLAVEPDGSFVVAWAGPGEGQITAKSYDSDDVQQGPALTVRSLGGSEIFADIDVAINDSGARMFIWTEDETFFRFPHVLGRAFDAAGSPVSDAFSVDGDPTRQYSGSEVQADGDGNFVVTWGRLAGNQFFAQTFAADGQRLDPAITVAEGALFVGSRYFMRLGPPRAGKLTFSYFDGRPIGRFLAEDLIFSDGFESGDTSAWSEAP